MTTDTVAGPMRTLRFESGQPIDLRLEWLLTNGLGGYASGPVRGGVTRRFHGVLVASLPAPVGRLVCVDLVRASAVQNGHETTLGEDDFTSSESRPIAPVSEFSLEWGLPVWRYRTRDWTIEKRAVMPYGFNTTHVLFRLLEGDPLTLRLRPLFQARIHEAALEPTPTPPPEVTLDGASIEISVGRGLPTVRWLAEGDGPVRYRQDPEDAAAEYAIERARGYDWQGRLWSPGAIDVPLSSDRAASFIVSTEPWAAVRATTPDDALTAERARRQRLLSVAGQPEGFAAELTLAADQFIVLPEGRVQEIARARSQGEEPRTIIAGYHWFTDWGRDTMISLEGLTLATGRWREAGWILRTFGHYVRDGLIPNLFPEGEALGLYHTADATLWFFHAVHRYVQTTGDRALLDTLLPTLVDIAEHHLRGTRFGIGVDPADHLLRQGAEGYQLTWMDAKVGDWVVTPRRGKAVEINALWYNALRLLADWLAADTRAAEADRWRSVARDAFHSFNARFWNPATRHLFDVVDGEGGNDAACRPNQLFAISLEHPVLDPIRWPDVLAVVRDELLTPVGLRSLSPRHPDYQARYDGDLRARDAAYHQGTVWAWLIGPFVDAWRRVHPDDQTTLRAVLAAFPDQMSRAGIGSISEIFDAEPPFTPRGCIAQAWSVAEALRVWRLAYPARQPQVQIPTGQ